MVVSIIAVLISMLLPALQNSREAARRVQCAANMKTWALAERLYATDNNDYVPPGFLPNPYPAEPQWAWWSWFDFYSLYVPVHTDTWKSIPGDRVNNIDTPTAQTCPSDNGTLNDPSWWAAYRLSYRTNQEYSGWNRWWQFSNCTQPSAKIYMTESNVAAPYMLPISATPVNNPNGGIAYWHSPGTREPGANYAWMDGHVTFESTVPSSDHWYNDPANHGPW